MVCLDAGVFSFLVCLGISLWLLGGGYLLICLFGGWFGWFVFWCLGFLFEYLLFIAYGCGLVVCL